MYVLVQQPGLVGLISTFQLSGSPDPYFYNCIAGNITITSILPRARRARTRRGTQAHRVQANKRCKRSTSNREYEEDASALKTDEGRGDRRNVQGELHTSDEP